MVRRYLYLTLRIFADVAREPSSTADPCVNLAGRIIVDFFASGLSVIREKAVLFVTFRYSDSKDEFCYVGLGPMA